MHSKGVSKICLPRTLLHRANCTTQAQNLVYDRDTGIVSSNSMNSGSSSQHQPQHQQQHQQQQLYRSVIGIEIHAQLAVPSKLFSKGPTKHHPSHNPQPNTSASSFDIAYPGALPLLSKSSVKGAIISAAALNCDIQETSRFERKHYTYADLPFGYQVTQQRWPIAKEGILKCRRYSPPGTGSGVIKKKKKKKRGRNSRGDSDQASDTDNTDRKSSMEEEDTQLSKFFEVGIDRIQMEQDTGKTIATALLSEQPNSTNTQYLIDFNRAGSALIEIVFRPQINAAHEAASVVSTLQSLLKHIETCDGKMEEGSLRCDLNVSIYPLSPPAPASGVDHDDSLCNKDDDNPFQSYLPDGVGHRVEVKNLNSIKQIIQSAEHEALRQTEEVLKGCPTGRETRTFDPKSGKTVKIRDKGGSVDYRFMPEPDLPPVRLNSNILGNDVLDLQDFLDRNLPELPEAAIHRLVGHYGISEASALTITADRAAIGFYEKCVEICNNELGKGGNADDYDLTKISTTVSNWLCNDLFALIKESATRNYDENGATRSDDVDRKLNHPVSVEYSNVDATRLGLLVSLILKETVSTTQAKKLLNVMYNEELETEPLAIAEANGWKLISDPVALKALCKNVLTHEKNRKQLEQYKQGGKHVRKMQKFFKGKIMAESKGNAHPELMANALQDVLEQLAPGVEA